MSFLIIRDGIEYGKPLRMYLCPPDKEMPPRLRRWAWSCQRELAALFDRRGDASRILETKVRAQRGSRIVKA